MYTLRRIAGNGVEINQSIGTSYTLIRKEQNPKEFERAMEVNADYVKGSEATIFALISFHNGTSVSWQFLYTGQKNFIMNETGGTFAHIKPD